MDTREIIELIRPYMNKTFTSWCMYIWGDKHYPRTDILDRYKSYIECDCRVGTCAWAAMTNWYCLSRWCNNKWTSWSTSTPKICEECARKKNKCQFCGKYLEIIGHYEMTALQKYFRTKWIVMSYSWDNYVLSVFKTREIIWEIPHKPLNLYSGQENINLLKFLNYD